tara:strand:- start:406 stop:660 length:255 start_codon:yes stop_codon:yes gene_type:complete
MSKMSEIDLIAQGVADHCMEIMYDTVDWQLGDQPLDGDDFNELHGYVMKKAIERMFFRIFKQDTYESRLKITNKIQSLLDNINE